MKHRAVSSGAGRRAEAVAKAAINTGMYTANRQKTGAKNHNHPLNEVSGIAKKGGM